MNRRYGASDTPLPASGSLTVGSLTVFGETALAARVRDIGSTGFAEDLPVVFIDHCDDFATAAALWRLGAERPEAQLVAHIRDPGLRRMAIARFDALKITPRPKLFGLARLAVESLFDRERFFEQAHWRGQMAFHAVIVGEGPFAQACFEEGLMAGIAGALQHPRFTFIVPEPEEFSLRFAARAPEIESSCEIAVAPFCAYAEEIGGLHALIEAERRAPVTAIFLCLEQPCDQLAWMSGLIDLQTRRNQALAPIFILAEAFPAACALAAPVGRGVDMARRVVVVDATEALDGSIAALLRPAFDGVAQKIHETYRRSFGGSAETDVAWENLPETYRDANRRAARHLPQKLWTIGLNWAGDGDAPGAVDPEAHAQVIRPVCDSIGEDAVMRRLARLEHDRWNADRRLDGWTYAATRDNARRRHPNLVPFDDPRFTEYDISKDVDQVRFLFRASVSPEKGGAAAAFTLGVLSARDANGVELSAAQRLLQDQPGRPLLLLSGLTDPGEVETVQTLLDAAAGEGRAHRLLVPTLPGFAAVVTQPNAGFEAARAALLADPRAIIAPLAMDDPTLYEMGVWQDPEIYEKIEKSLAAFIRSRATAVVSVAPSSAGERPMGGQP